MYVKVDLKEYLTPLIKNIVDENVRLTEQEFTREETNSFVNQLVDLFVKTAENITKESEQGYIFPQGFKDILFNGEPKCNSTGDNTMVRGLS